jgi:hypothetical protein
MKHASPVISASLSVAFAAGVAGVFTVATASSSAERPAANRLVNSGQLAPVLGEIDLNSIFFNSQPFGGTNTPIEPSVKSRSVVSEQPSPAQLKINRENDPMVNGCESGLSPDISPTVPMQPGRCIADRGISAKYASLR